MLYYSSPTRNRPRAKAKAKRNKTMKTIKKCRAYLDGRLLCEDVLQAALDNRVMLDELKRRLVAENEGHKVTFKYE